MSASRRLQSVVRAALAAALAVGLAGCSYDYEQHTDRVAYSAGDAVRANLEAETTNPYKRSIYRTNGLGANGDVMPPPTAAPATASSSGQTASTTN